MDRYMQYLKYHYICELFHTCPVFALRLGWVLHWKFNKSIFKKNRVTLVTRGNHEKPIIDYSRALLSIVTIRDPNVIQFDIPSACLHSTFKEEIYMEQPDGYVDPRKGTGYSTSRTDFTGWCGLGEYGTRS